MARVLGFPISQPAATWPFCAGRRPLPLWLLLALSCLLAIVPLLQPLQVRLAPSLGRMLEARVPQGYLPPEKQLDGIIVLGGSSARVEAALRLAARHPEASIILSGPGEDEVALATRSLATGRFAVDRRAKNTYENGLFSKDLVQPRAGECWVVVTSALHMPRAIGVFERVGFPVVPWPVADSPRDAKSLAAPVWHEVIGLLAYWAWQRTGKLYPRARTPTSSCDA